MSLAVIPPLFATIFLAARYPYALAALALFLPMESPGVGAVISNTYRLSVPLIYGGYLLAIFKTLHVLWVRRNSSFASRRMMTAALLAMGTSGWMALSMFACDVSKFQAISRSLGAVPGVFLALAYYNHRPARILLGVALAVHLIISCGVIVFPYSPLAVFRQTTSAGAVLPNVWSMETTSYKDSAQFESAAQLAFYAAVALMIGVSLLLYHRGTVARAAGACLAVLGIAATFFTVERGIWIGIFVGILVIIAPLRRERIGRAAYAAIMLALTLGVLAVCTSVENPILIALRDHFLAVKDDAYRVPVAVRSLDVLVSKPLFGVGGEVLELIDIAGGAPHQSFYFFAVAYGVPAGVCVAILTWWSMATNFARRRDPYGAGLSQYDRLVGKSLGWVVVAMALTNGMSGGMLGWICLGFACLPWAYSAPKSAMVRVVARPGSTPSRMSSWRNVAPMPAGER